MMDYYKKTADEIVEEFSSQTKAGLSNQEAQKRYEKYGPNRFAEEKKDSMVKKILLSLT
ncbi:cation-transporting P-type ATPase, partial [Enterococcus canintestini]